MHAALHSVITAAARYRGLGAVRRAARAAVVVPAMFALGDKVIGDPTIATFAAFGSFALVLLVDFPGPLRTRLQSILLLTVAGEGLLCLGTVVSGHVWLAVAAMAGVGFGVLFAGVVSSVVAGATTSLLLAFILPVSLAAGASAVPTRMAGWGLAGGAALVATALLWPAPVHDPLRVAAGDACRALAGRLRSDVSYRRAGGTEIVTAAHSRSVSQAQEAVDGLRRAFLSTPYRPTGLSTAARATVRLVDELSWVDVILAYSLPVTGQSAASRVTDDVKLAAATVMECGADVLAGAAASPDALPKALVDLQRCLRAMEDRATLELPLERARPDSSGGMDDQRVAEFVTSLNPSFRAQELSFVVALVGANVERAAAAERRSWWQRLLGHQPDGAGGLLPAARERAASHLERHSVWLQNSLRGAAALGLAVGVAGATGVQHSFWVVFGTLSVLRSNALNTGQNALRAVTGTAVGFAVGAVVIEAIGTDDVVLWLLLPLAVFAAGVTPALVSFSAGQAAFTVTLVVLYNLVQPTGWTVGLVRVEDVAIGCGVSLVVGLLFWPRGATATLRAALAEAYADSASYVDRAVGYAALRCDRTDASAPPPAEPAVRAAAAARRLDDTFRSYLAERGPKPVPLAEMTSLVTGVAVLRLAAAAIIGLWENVETFAYGDRAAAREELLATSATVREWYGDFAAGLLDSRHPRDPLDHDKVADGRLITAVRRDLRTADGTATATAVRVIWTADHLDAVRRLQRTVSGAARSVCAPRRAAGWDLSRLRRLLVNG
jgi:uncharacterized membrane protein YccC